MKIYVNGILQGGGAGIPGTPEAVLLKESAPLTIVALNAQGEGTELSYPETAAALGVPSLPGAPSAVLLKPSAPSRIVALNAQGVGTELTYEETASALGVSAPVLRYASDAVVEPGGAANGDATKSGVGPTSTITLTSATVNTTYGSGGATAPRAVIEVPADAEKIEVTIRVMSTTGVGDTNRFLAVALRNTPNGGAPAALWGTGMPTVTSPNVYSGGLMSGANTGNIFSGVVANNGLFAADRWLRATWQPRAPYYAILTGAGSAGAEPALWNPPAGWSAPISNGGVLAVGSGVLAIAVYFQTFGGSGSLSVTFQITVKVWT